MNKNKRYALRKEREKEIALMEYQDANGIRRKPFRPAFFSARKIMMIKTVLLICLPVFYFVYSPLLLPICAFYASLYFITKNTEKNLNDGMRKDLHIKLPKLDASIALVLVAVTIGAVALTALTTSTRSSMFEGRSREEITSTMEERGMSASRISSMMERMEESGAFLTSGQRRALQILTLNTGHRVFFQTKNQMAVRGISFARPNRIRIGDGSGAREGGEALPNGDISQGGERPQNVFIGGAPNMSSIPFSMIISQIVSVINFILFILFGITGIIVVILTRKKKLDTIKRDKK